MEKIELFQDNTRYTFTPIHFRNKKISVKEVLKKSQEITIIKNGTEASYTHYQNPSEMSVQDARSFRIHTGLWGIQYQSFRKNINVLQKKFKLKLTTINFIIIFNISHRLPVSFLPLWWWFLRSLFSLSCSKSISGRKHNQRPSLCEDMCTCIAVCVHAHLLTYTYIALLWYFCFVFFICFLLEKKLL